jgi:hypothetical protein
MASKEKYQDSFEEIYLQLLSYNKKTKSSKKNNTKDFNSAEL